MKKIEEIFKTHDLVLNSLNDEKQLESHQSLLEILEDKLYDAKIRRADSGYEVCEKYTEYLAIVEAAIIVIEERIGRYSYLVIAEAPIYSGWGCDTDALGSFDTEERALSYIKIQKVKHKEYRNMKIVKIPINCNSWKPIEIMSAME